MFEEPAVDQGLLSLRIPPVSASISINDRDRERGGGEGIGRDGRYERWGERAGGGEGG